MYNVIFIFLLYRNLVDKDRQQVNFLLPNIFRVVLRDGEGGLNPPQRPPYVLERLETEEMKVGGGKKILLFPSCRHLPCCYYF